VPKRRGGCLEKSILKHQKPGVREKKRGKKKNARTPTGRRRPRLWSRWKGGMSLEKKGKGARNDGKTVNVYKKSTANIMKQAKRQTYGTLNQKKRKLLVRDEEARRRKEPSNPQPQQPVSQE